MFVIRKLPSKEHIIVQLCVNGALINPINQNSKRLSIPDLILVDVFTAIYFVLVAIANSAWLLRDHMIVYTYFNFGCKEYLTETERKFFLPWRVPAFVIFLSLQLLSYFQFSII